MAKIFHAHLHGDRVTKYDRLIHSTISDTAWLEISPQTPFYLLIPQDTHLLKEYNQGWKITEIMPVNSVGIVTGQDGKTIAFQKSDAELLAHEHNLSKSVVTQILYRPFDTRFIVYDSQVVTRPRGEVMRHMIAGKNLALLTSRLTKGETYQHAQVTQNIAEVICMSPKTSNNGFVFPLYTYPKTNVEKEMGMSRHPNFSQPFLKDLTDRLGYPPTPEAIFHYIYAIFHSPTYRSRYAEFLKIDFPRVPLTRNDALFCQLAAYGEELVALHLMKSAKLEQKSKLPQFVEQEGKCIVEPGHPKYEVKSRSVIINKKGDRFTHVPEAVWNFYVGGYPVCAKWLKDRKGRTLSPQDIAHYQQIVVALGETITLMAAIDQAIPGFPIE